MKKLIMLILILFTTVANAKFTKIAVIDSGFNPVLGSDIVKGKLCPNGHYDFSDNTKSIGFDRHTHGTNVTNLIAATIGEGKYCFLIYKIWGQLHLQEDYHLEGKAIKKALKAGAKYINISMAFRHYSPYTFKMIKKGLKQNVRFFVAAGNNRTNLNKICKIYPACYKIKHDNYHVVGALNICDNIAEYSNYGKAVTMYEIGDYVGLGRGTSYASPVALGKYVRRKLKGE